MYLWMSCTDSCMTVHGRVLSMMMIVVELVGKEADLQRLDCIQDEDGGRPPAPGRKTRQKNEDLDISLYDSCSSKILIIIMWTLTDLSIIYLIKWGTWFRSEIAAWIYLWTSSLPPSTSPHHSSPRFIEMTSSTASILPWTKTQLLTDKCRSDRVVLQHVSQSSLCKQFSAIAIAAVPFVLLQHSVTAQTDGYVPVTYTVTSYATPTSSINPADTQGSSTETLTSTSTRTQTVLRSQVTPPSVSQNNGGSYYYAVESGTTSWLSNISPSAGVPQVTLTTTIFVTPGSTGIPTTTLDAITVLPPPYVSTTYSLDSPDSTHTVMITQTQTQTVSDTITRTRSAFTSPGTNGWNSTSSSINSDSTNLVSGIPTTITGAIYWSTGNRITSTSLTTLTLTLTRAHQSTITVTDSQSASILPTAETPPLVTPVPLSSQSVGIYSVSLGSSSSVNPGAMSTVAAGNSVAAASYGEQPSSISDSASSGFSTSYQSSGQTTAQLSSMSSLQPPAPFGPLTITSSSASLTQGEFTTLAQSSSASYAPSQSFISTMTSASSAIVAPLSSSETSDTVKSTASPQSHLSSSFSSSLSSRAAPPYQTATNSQISLSSPASSGYSVSPIDQSSTSFLVAQSSIASLSGVSAASSSSFTASQGVSSSSVGSYSQSASSMVPSSSSSQASYSAVSSTASSSQASASQSVSIQSSTLSSYLPSSVTASASTTGNAASSTSPLPSVCGEHGNFTLDFDDLPMYTTNKTIDITEAAPIFNGYHHLAWSNGYVYAPPPKDPFSPHSAPHLAVFLGNASGNSSDLTPSAMAPVSGMIGPGEFGDGSSSAVSAFWFDAYSAWLGCDNPGPESCTYVITAFVWDEEGRREKQIDQQTATTSACPGFQNCQLQEVQFPQSFVNLTGLQIQAYKGADQVMFFMDDVQLAWSNNTCAAGLRRAQSPRGAPPSKRGRR
ncbi:hypothetical protein MRB53_037853 [Persea americana]|nr:hypothetical protein MRB53_037853 [Persea americana]